MKMILDSFASSRSKSNLWLVPVFEGQLSAVAKRFGWDTNTAQGWGFEGKKDQVCTIAVNNGRLRVVLLGMGKVGDFKIDHARQVIARGLRHNGVQKSKDSTVLFVASPLTETKISPEILVESLAEGAALGTYTFTRFKAKGTEKDALPKFPARLIVALDRVRLIDRKRFNDGLILAKWTNWARDLINQSQSHITATALANLARSTARKFRRIRCTIHNKKQIAALRMGLLLAVNQGSEEEPRFIVLEYRGGRANERPVCLVGKGLTFDTGGYNLKPTDSLKGMHMDKSGAAGMLASFFAAVELGIKKNLICLVPTTDNRVSGKAYVPGDVFVGCNGISVEIDNTDAEGRLILADALAYAKKFNPSHMVDMATLTGAAVVALGDKASAVFSDDPAMTRELIRAGSEAGELMWELPLWDDYNEKFKSQIADIKNCGDRWAGAITAALFLKRFVPEGVKWCHIDMAGKMKPASDEPYNPGSSAYGFGPRVLVRWLRKPTAGSR